MWKRIFFTILLICFSFLSSNSALAFSPKNDPQYVIVNFASINELDWSAPQSNWDTKIKPQIVSQIREMRKVLDPSPNTQRILGWSTLMEYMNFPLDTPNDASPYAIKMRRILEIADEENFPVFLPLNGFQWWDQLPELYNWWDPDGTHTDPRFFSRQKNPEDFRKRFIAGYDPNNRWNVEWQSWDTPMKLNWRNWGGGGFRLAPPPNISNHNRTAPTYRSIQQDRLRVLLKQVVPYIQKWEWEGRTELFAGLSIGTEVSLNASVTPRDEFTPYGYRAVQDFLCDTDKPTCGLNTKFSALQIDVARRRSVNQYLVDLTRFVSSFDIPKVRTYTHVWSEALPGDPRYTNYADTAFTLYARPGMSFYGYAQHPLSLPDWNQSLKERGYPSWGAVEYSAGTSKKAWDKGLASLFENTTDTAKIVVIYNWQEIARTGAVFALRNFLSSPVKKQTCEATDPQIINRDGEQNPTKLSWIVPESSNVYSSFSIHIKQGNKTTSDAPNVYAQEVSPSSREIALPPLGRGVYSWYVESHVCTDKKVTSQPHTFVVIPMTHERSLPTWVEIYMTVKRYVPFNAFLP